MPSLTDTSRVPVVSYGDEVLVSVGSWMICILLAFLPQKAEFGCVWLTKLPRHPPFMSAQSSECQSTGNDPAGNPSSGHHHFQLQQQQDWLHENLDSSQACDSWLGSPAPPVSACGPEMAYSCPQGYLSERGARATVPVCSDIYTGFKQALLLLANG